MMNFKRGGRRVRNIFVPILYEWLGLSVHKKGLKELPTTFLYVRSARKRLCLIGFNGCGLCLGRLGFVGPGRKEYSV